MKNVKREAKIEQYKKLTEYLRGTAKVLTLLAKAIDEAKEFDTESEKLMSKIGANILFFSVAYQYGDLKLLTSKNYGTPTQIKRTKEIISS